MKGLNGKKKTKKVNKQEYSDSKLSISIKKTVLKLFYVLIGIISIYQVIFIASTTITGKNYIEVFGVSIITIDNNLMQPSIKKNTLVILKNTGDNEYFAKGEIIGYTINDNIRVNRIINIINNNGNIYYITKSDMNFHEDIEPIQRKDVKGRILFEIPGIGFLVKIAESKVTTIFIIIFLIIKFNYNKYVYKRNIVRLKKKE